MADSFVPDSFVADKPAGKPDGKPEALGPAGKYVDPIANLPGVGGRLAALGQHIVNPKGAAENVQSLAATALPVAGLFGAGGRLGASALKGVGGMTEKIAPTLGRMATGLGVGVGSSAARGESPTAMATHGVADALITGLVEAALGKLAQPGKALVKETKAIAKTIQETIESNATAQAAYEWAKRAPMEAMEVIRSRVPNSFKVPVISEALAKEAGTTLKHFKDKALTLDEAVEGLTKLRGKDYEEALIQLKRQMNLTEFSPRTPRAGESFSMRVSPYIKDPVPAQVPTLPANPRAPIGSDASRAVADTLATHDAFGIPLGVGAPLMAWQAGLGPLAKSAAKAVLP